MKKIICFFIGHSPITEYVETENHIYGKRCNRCGKPLGMSLFWHSMPACPDSTTWNEHVARRKDEIKRDIEKNPVQSAILNLKHNWKI